MRTTKEVRNKAQTAPAAPIVHSGSGVRSVTLDFSTLAPEVIDGIDAQLRECYAKRKAAQDEYRRIKAEAGPRHGVIVEADIVYRGRSTLGHTGDASQPEKQKAPTPQPWTA